MRRQLSAVAASAMVVSLLPTAAVADEAGCVVIDELQAAIGEADPNDGICVKAGTLDLGSGTLEIDVAGLTLLGPNDGAQAGSDRVGEAVIKNGRVDFLADDITFAGFKVEGSGDRLLAPRGSEGTTIRSNVISGGMRGVQGDWHGRPTGLTITDNTFETEYGIAGTEDSDDLVVKYNHFDTSVEGVGFGQGTGNATVSGNLFAGTGRHLELYGDEVPGLDGLVETNSFHTSVLVHKEDGSPRLEAVFSSLVDAVEVAESGDEVTAGPGTYEGSVRVTEDDLTLRGANAGIDGTNARGAESHVVGQGSTATERDPGAIGVDAQGVLIDGFSLDGGETGRAVRLFDDASAEVENNVITDDVRGVQGNATSGHGVEAVIRANSITAPFGVAGTEHVAIEIVENAFVVSDEGVGLGEGVSLTGAADSIDGLRCGNSFTLEGEAVAVRDYREDPPAEFGPCPPPPPSGGGGTTPPPGDDDESTDPDDEDTDEDADSDVPEDSEDPDEVGDPEEVGLAPGDVERIIDQFTDVDMDNTFATEIARVISEGVARGYGDGTFGPNDDVTRAQMSTFIARVLGLDTSGTPSFVDVGADSVHAGAIAALESAAIALGVGDGRFDPNGTLTRAQAASLLARALGLDTSGTADFADVDPDDVHAGAIAALVDAGIMFGGADGTFGPDGNLTRAQMAGVLSRVLDRD